MEISDFPGNYLPNDNVGPGEKETHPMEVSILQFHFQMFISKLSRATGIILFHYPSLGPR